MRESLPAMTCRWGILIAFLCASLSVGCKSRDQSGAPDMTMSLAFPKTDFLEDLFAISPDGSRVIHSPDHVGAWDGDRGRPFEVRDAKTSGEIAEIHLPIPPAIDDQINSIQFCDHGKYLLINASVFFDPDHPPQSEKTRGSNAEADYLRVLDTKDYTLHTDISLSAVEYEIPKQVLEQPHGGYEGSGNASLVACAADAPFAVVAIGHSLNLFDIRVFNLDTGAEATGFRDPLLLPGVQAVAISPQGTSLALYRTRGAEGAGDQAVDFQITVVDLRAKKVAKDIGVRTPYNFNAIKYAGESTIAVELFDQQQYESPSENWTGPKNIFYTRASIHLFDVGSGAELRTISRPDNGQFRLLDISADGRTMLVRTDSDHFCFSCSWGGGEEIITDSRFMLWNPQTGRPIAKSPSLKVIHHRCFLPPSNGWLFGGCVASDEEPELELSQGGGAVAALWKQGNQPILVYSLPNH